MAHEEDINNKKLFGFIGIAMKAGKIISGTNLTAETIRSQNSQKKVPHLVIIASDASENSKKRIINCCVHYNVKYYETDVQSETLAHIIGKKSSISVIAVTELNLAKEIEKIITER
jgi:ribosomal protein L7Ae-like RNA K-turn-binding protein